MPHSTNSRLGGGRRATLTAALGFALLEPCTRELEVLHGWLDTWRGIGDVVIGMARRQYDCEMRQYEGHQWRGTFYVMAPMHSFTTTRPRPSSCSRP